MNIFEILMPMIVLGGLGLVFGVVLGVAAKIFAVEKDERIDRIIAVLPCANCGGCGYAGCSAYASSVANGTADVAACTVGGEECASKVAEIMGVKAEYVKKVARIKCAGDCEASPSRYKYKGLESCEAAARLGGGPKSCFYGCMGLGSCAKVCDRGAISIQNGIAVVDEEKCGACGKCVSVCPKKLIEIVPAKQKYVVACVSKDKGSEMKAACSTGCIGCKICEKTCPSEAIAVEDNIAKIDYEKCTLCGVCAEKCPRKIIKQF